MKNRRWASTAPPLLDATQTFSFEVFFKIILLSGNLYLILMLTASAVPTDNCADRAISGGAMFRECHVHSGLFLTIMIMYKCRKGVAESEVFKTVHDHPGDHIYRRNP